MYRLLGLEFTWLAASTHLMPSRGASQPRPAAVATCNWHNGEGPFQPVIGPDFIWIGRDVRLQVQFVGARLAFALIRRVT